MTPDFRPKTAVASVIGRILGFECLLPLSIIRKFEIRDFELLIMDEKVDAVLGEESGG